MTETAVVRTSVCLFTCTTRDGQRAVLLTVRRRGPGAERLELFEAELKPGESGTRAAIRATAQGCGLEPAPGDVHERAGIAHHHPSAPDLDALTGVHLAEYHGGRIVEQDGAHLRWVTLAELPAVAAQMPDDTRYWLPPVLAGQCLQAVITHRPHGAGVADARGTAWLPRRGRTA
jgi:hypothetical protein